MSTYIPMHFAFLLCITSLQLVCVLCTLGNGESSQAPACELGNNKTICIKSQMKQQGQEKKHGDKCNHIKSNVMTMQQFQKHFTGPLQRKFQK